MNLSIVQAVIAAIAATAPATASISAVGECADKHSPKNFMLTIQYNPQQDIRNWIRIAKNDGDKIVLTAPYPFDRRLALTEKNADQIIASLPTEILTGFTEMAKNLEQLWLSYEDGVVRQILNYLNKPLQNIDAKASLTTAYRMPYDAKDQWFMIPTHKPQTEQFRVIAHELFHLYHLQTNPTLSRVELEKTVQEFLAQLALE